MVDALDVVKWSFPNAKYVHVLMDKFVQILVMFEDYSLDA